MKIILKPNAAALARMPELPRQVEVKLSDPALLRALGTTHRAQEESIFSTEGATGGTAPWAALNPRYAARKAKAVGRKKILQLTGTMKRQFTFASASGYVQQFIPRGTLGIFRFGARSSVAAAHKFGNPSLAPMQSATARRVFGGIAPRLPVRDMVTKSAAHLVELRQTLLTFYIARMKQQLRAGAKLGRRA